jgi:hypothetical protein
VGYYLYERIESFFIVSVSGAEFEIAPEERVIELLLKRGLN